MRRAVRESLVRCRSISSSGSESHALGFNRVYSDVELDRTERYLEREIRRESCIPPRDKKVARLRLQGEHVLHSKHVLLVVVILNLVDCVLVLGELILDIHYIKELRDDREAFSQQFVDTMQAKYPEHLRGHHIENMRQLFDELYKADCQWPTANESHVHVDVGLFDIHSQTNVHVHHNETKPIVFDVRNKSENTTASYPLYITQGIHEPYNDTVQNRRSVEHDVVTANGKHGPSYDVESDHSHEVNHEGDHHGESHHGGDHHGSHHREHSVWEHVAHGMHKASIAILGVLFVENLAKAICMGRDFLIKKLEVFDAVVVFISFVVDLVLLKGIMEYKIQDVIFILTFLLPWRVIRVVNSLIVAVLDHEHFRLKMLYQEKKKIANELKDLKKQEKGWDFHLQKIEKFCESEGIPKWKIRQHTAMGRKQSTITTMASLALNGFLKGMMLMSPSDSEMFEKSLTMSSQAAASNQPNASLGTISEGDSVDTEDDQKHLTESHSHDTDTTGNRFYLTPRNSHQFEVPKIVEPLEKSTENHKDNSQRHGILKSSSRDHLKNVSFQPKEHKPLLHKQESVTSGDSVTFIDDSN